MDVRIENALKILDSVLYWRDPIDTGEDANSDYNNYDNVSPEFVVGWNHGRSSLACKVRKALREPE